MKTDLPAVRMTGLTTETSNSKMPQTRTPSIDQQQDHKLLQTAIRWTTYGWYVVANNDAGNATSREGPIDCITEVEAPLETLANSKATKIPDNPSPENNPTERIDTVIREGLTDRLLSETRAWIKAIDAAENRVASKASHPILDPRLTAGEYPEIDECFRKMQRANNAYEEWLAA